MHFWQDSQITFRLALGHNVYRDHLGPVSARQPIPTARYENRNLHAVPMNGPVAKQRGFVVSHMRWRRT